MRKGETEPKAAAKARPAKGSSKARGKRAGEDRIGHARSVSDLVPRVGRQSFRRFGFVEASVVARWPDIVGPELARMTSPDSIRFPQGKRNGGTLTLSVASARAPLVQHAEPNILEKVNRYFGYGAVSRVAIRQGAAEPVQEQRAPAREPSSYPRPEQPELKAIADDGLRTSLEALASQIAVTKGPPKIS